jgi:uroporphyrinogen-III decarboxylase
MNAKERVRTAINRETPDQVPLGFYLADYDTIEKVIGRPTYVRNKAQSQIAFWEGRRDEVVESYKKDTVEFYEKIDTVDLITYKEACIVPPRDYEPDPPELIAEDTWRDREGRIYKISKISNEILCVEDPARWTRKYTVEMFEEPVEDVAPDPSIFEAWDYLIDHLGEDRYIAGYSGGIVAMLLLGGMERGLCEYIENPDVVRAAIRHAVKEQNQKDPYYIRPGMDAVFIENDLAGTNGPLMSPAMFREFCFQAMKERIDHMKSISGHQVIFHSCGNNWPLLEMFADAGVECYQSLQTNAGMEVGRLKEAYGERLCFWGGIALENLIMGEPEDVRKNVREALERGAPGGGFILGPSHSIARGTKYDNFMAMLDEYDKLKDKY